MAADYSVCVSLLSAASHLHPSILGISLVSPRCADLRPHVRPCIQSTYPSIWPVIIYLYWARKMTDGMHERVCVCVCVCVQDRVVNIDPGRQRRGCTPIGIPDVEANYCLCHLDSPCSRRALHREHLALPDCS